VAVPSIDFVNGVAGVVFDSTYDVYELVLTNIAPATDDVEAWLRVGTGAGPTYQVTNYEYISMAWVTAAGNSGTGAATAAQMALSRQSATADVGNAAGESFNATIRIYNPAGSGTAAFTGQTNWGAASGWMGFANFGGRYRVAGAITAVRFQFETGNVASGQSAALYGISKS